VQPTTPGGIDSTQLVKSMELFAKLNEQMTTVKGKWAAIGAEERVIAEQTNKYNLEKIALKDRELAVKQKIRDRDRETDQVLRQQMTKK